MTNLEVQFVGDVGGRDEDPRWGRWKYSEDGAIPETLARRDDRRNNLRHQLRNKLVRWNLKSLTSVTRSLEVEKWICFPARWRFFDSSDSFRKERSEKIPSGFLGVERRRAAADFNDRPKAVDRSFTLFFFREMATESIMKRVARINFKVIHFFFYKCTLTCYRKLLTESCLLKTVPKCIESLK